MEFRHTCFCYRYGRTSPVFALAFNLAHSENRRGKGHGTGTKEFPVWRLQQSFNYGSFPIGAKGPLKAKLSQDFLVVVAAIE